MIARKYLKETSKIIKKDTLGQEIYLKQTHVSTKAMILLYSNSK